MMGADGKIYLFLKDFESSREAFLFFLLLFYFAGLLISMLYSLRDLHGNLDGGDLYDPGKQRGSRSCDLTVASSTLATSR